VNLIKPFILKIMSLPNKQLTTFQPSEIFFLAENSLITIIPRQSMDAISLIGFSIPKLTAMRQTKVPLWAAILLKKQGRCSVVPPEWLTDEILTLIYQHEIQNNNKFNDELPFQWIEISQILLENCADDLDSPANVIRNLLRDIREARQSKARMGLGFLNENHLQMDNLGLLEINEMRPFVSGIMDKLKRIHELAQDD
ncbi:putative DNA replication complex GINS protein PSF2, partial [Nadsonia fulvescens var. elongata DSM 6958]